MKRQLIVVTIPGPKSISALDAVRDEVLYALKDGTPIILCDGAQLSVVDYDSKVRQ